MWYNTRISKLIGIQYPVIQGPFGGGYSTVELASTVSNAGALGSFGCQPYSADEIVSICNEIRKKTNKPFNINLWVNSRDERLNHFSAEDFRKLVELHKELLDGSDLQLSEMPEVTGHLFEDQVEAIFHAKPKVFSFVYGIPSGEILDKCRRLGIITIGTATTVDEAIELEKAGVDVIVASGMEAGGHRVSFLEPAVDSLTGTFSLIPQVADAVKVPVVAAGGIADARGVKAALALGAEGVQIGTAFLATDQSGASQKHKKALFSPEARYTTLTKIYTGRLARGIKTILTQKMKDLEHTVAPYPLQGKLMALLHELSVNGNADVDFKSYWAGQSAPLLKYRDAGMLINILNREMEP